MPMALQLLPIGGTCPLPSVLLVACNICPRAQVQYQACEPLYSWRNLLGKSDAFTRHVRSLEVEARREGLGVGRLKTSPTSAMCLWSETERRALNRMAEMYEAVAVVGCDSAVLTARRAVPNKAVIPLAKTMGIANYTLRSRFFFTVDIVAGEVVKTCESEPADAPLSPERPPTAAG